MVKNSLKSDVTSVSADMGEKRVGGGSNEVTDTPITKADFQRVTDGIRSRIRRFEEVYPPETDILTNREGPFAKLIVECHLLKEFGLFQASMCLAHHLLLAMVRYVNEDLARRTAPRGPVTSKDYRNYYKVVERLGKKEMIDDSTREQLKSFLVDRSVDQILDKYRRVVEPSQIPNEELKSVAEGLLLLVLSFERKIYSVDGRFWHLFSLSDKSVSEGDRASAE